MKTKIVFLFLAVVLSTSLFAQERREGERKQLTPKEIATKMTERLKNQLQLTADQEKKVYDINLEFMTKQQELRAEKEKKEKNRMALREEMEQKMNSVLTPEQQKKMAELKTKRERKQPQKGDTSRPRKRR